MTKILPLALAAVLLAGCGATNGLTAANRAVGSAQALSKAGAEKGVRGMFRYYFAQADADKNGYLTVEEMPAGNAPAGAPGEPALDPLAAKKAMFEKMDLNKNGRVTQNEFATKENVQQVTVMFRREVGKMFANLDLDGNRILVADELVDAVVSMEAADLNKNGKVTLSELEDAMGAVLAAGGGFGKPANPVAPPAQEPVAPPAEEPVAPPSEG
ncbi:transaldolase/EF-hand domain-containing protein [compost metagenome]